ncbi:hypothetical protein [Paraburkholderia sediminicola]|uniref:hypothetical protein n=1 Tax=Paraburkholderia sediminicola TaxID=458836 RepID=UPI0038B9E99A
MITRQGLAPKTITLGGYAASHRAVREMKADQFLPADTTLRVKVFEQFYGAGSSQRQVQDNAMVSFKRFRNAAITISSVELMHRIRKGQFNLVQLRLKMPLHPQFGGRSFQHDDAVMNMPFFARAHNLHHNPTRRHPDTWRISANSINCFETVVADH